MAGTGRIRQRRKRWIVSRPRAIPLGHKRARSSGSAFFSAESRGAVTREPANAARCASPPDGQTATDIGSAVFTPKFKCPAQGAYALVHSRQSPAE